MMLRTRFMSRPFFRDLAPDVFSGHTDWMLGEKVYKLALKQPGSASKLQIPSPLGHMLNYEYEVRKKACDLWADDKSRSYRDCLAEAQKCKETRQFEFIDKLSLPPRLWDIPNSGRQPKVRIDVPPEKSGGDGPNLSRNQKKRAAKAKKKANAPAQAAHPPPAAEAQRPTKRQREQIPAGPNGWRHPEILQKLDGKQFCFNWNKTGSCQAGSACPRLHKCQVNGCPQTPAGHRTTQCPLLASKGIVLQS